MIERIIEYNGQIIMQPPPPPFHPHPPLPHSTPPFHIHNMLHKFETTSKVSFHWYGVSLLAVCLLDVSAIEMYFRKIHVTWSTVRANQTNGRCIPHFQAERCPCVISESSLGNCNEATLAQHTTVGQHYMLVKMKWFNMLYWTIRVTSRRSSRGKMWNFLSF